MAQKKVTTTLNEDMQVLGIPGVNMAEQARLGGIPLSEDKDEGPADDELQEMMKEGYKEGMTCPKCKKGKMSKHRCPDCGFEVKPEYRQDPGKQVAASTNEEAEGDDEVHPLDAPEVNEDLFTAIMDLPFDDMKAEDVEEVLEALKEKDLPEDASDGLKERAEEVVDFLIEAVAKKTRRAKAGSMAKKASFQCPPGTRKDPKDKAGRRCIRAAKAAGGSGKLAKETRKKGRWAKSGKGKKSARKSSRWAARREDIQSPFAAELHGLLEDTQEEIQESVRDEIIERIGDILEMFCEEFNDEAVTRVFEEAYEPVLSSMESGRLDEDVMDEDEFVAEIKPLVTLIHKSIERIGADSGN